MTYVEKWLFFNIKVFITTACFLLYGLCLMFLQFCSCFNRTLFTLLHVVLNLNIKETSGWSFKEHFHEYDLWNIHVPVCYMKRLVMSQILLLVNLNLAPIEGTFPVLWCGFGLEQFFGSAGIKTRCWALMMEFFRTSYITWCASKLLWMSCTCLKL